MSRHIVIIGGGISGLSTAYYLLQAANQGRSSLKITLLESRQRFGGVIQTLREGPCSIEAGADAIEGGGSRGLDFLDLCRDLGLQDELVEAPPCFRRFFILRERKLIDVPDSIFSFSSFNPLDFFRRVPLNFFEKCRIFAEPWIPPQRDAADESIGHFIRRRFGKGFYDEVVSPLIRGVYMADPEALSVNAMFPRLKLMEQRFGSLGKAMLFQERVKGKPSGSFFTFRSGLEILSQALVRELNNCEIRTSSKVLRCEREQDWKILLENGETLRADAVCLAMTASDSATLLRVSAPELSRGLSGIRCDSVAAVNLIFKAEHVPARVPDFGFVVPADHRQNIFSSLKWLGKTADSKHICVRAFISGKECDRSDEVLEQKVLEVLRDSFALTALPSFISVMRYPEALPQYEAGHLERVAVLKKEINNHGGLFLTGNGFDGFGIGACICQARVAAQKMASFLSVLVVGAEIR